MSKEKKQSFDVVLSAFNKGDVISENVTLKQIADVSRMIEASGFDGGELAAWTFISPNYIYTGDADADVEAVRNIHIK